MSAPLAHRNKLASAPGSTARLPIDDTRIRDIMELAPPAHLLREFPASDTAAKTTYEARGAIHRVLHSHGWLILYTHDVSDTPTRYGTTPKRLDWALGRVAAARIEILPVREALPVALGL